MARKNPTARAGNYRQEVDASGMDESMKSTLGLTRTEPMNKLEKGYLSGAKNKNSATEAIRRARRANKRAPLPE